MKNDSQAHTKHVALILFTFLSLSNSIAYSQEHQKNNADAQLNQNKAVVLQSKPIKIKQNKLEAKAALATLPDKEKRPKVKKLADKVTLTNVEALPNKL